jgi:hypothetical protein
VIYRIIKQLEACSVAWMVQPTHPTAVIPGYCSLVSLVFLSCFVFVMVTL